MKKKQIIACILAFILAGTQWFPATAAPEDPLLRQEERDQNVELQQDQMSASEEKQDSTVEEEKQAAIDTKDDAEINIEENDDVDCVEENGNSTENQSEENSQEAGIPGNEVESEEETETSDTGRQEKESRTDQIEPEVMSVEETVPGVAYHVLSDKESVEKKATDGAVAGQAGSGRQIERVAIDLYAKEGNAQIDGGIRYRAHVQNIGWMDWVNDGAYVGADNKTLRIEAIQIELTGNLKDQYDVYYTGCVQNIGWLGWAKNGQSAGTEAFSWPLEAIRICLTKKGDTPPGDNQGYFVKGLPTEALTATAHIQTYGDMTVTGSGKVIGTTGKKKRMEGLMLNIRQTGESGYPSGGIRYRAHVQRLGWQGWMHDGELAGTRGKSLRMEAVQIELTGDLAKYYDVYYSAHVQQFGWLGWAKNGQSAGSEAFSYRMEAIKICLVKKESAAPGKTSGAFCQGYSTNNLKYSGHVQKIGNTAEVSNNQILGTVGKGLRMEALKIRLVNPSVNGKKGGIQYRAHVQNIGWQGWKQNGDLAGTTGKSLRMEAVQMKLSGGLSEYYDIYYRVHVQNIGWMGWAKNGQSAGTTGYGYRMEAIQIQLIPKGGTAPANSGYFRQYTGKKSLNVAMTYQYPKYPNGCEAISLYMALRYYGYMLTTNDICYKYLPRGPLHSTNPYTAYMGNPGSLTGGYGCWASVICQTAKNYFEAVNVKNRSAKNITGTSMEGLFQYIDRGIPVVVWGTLNMGNTTWFRAGSKNGVTFYWPSRAHCVLLTGYDKNRKVIKVNDPIRGKVEYSFSSFEKAYKTMNRNAMVIQ